MASRTDKNLFSRTFVTLTKKISRPRFKDQPLTLGGKVYHESAVGLQIGDTFCVERYLDNGLVVACIYRDTRVILFPDEYVEATTVPQWCIDRGQF